MSERIGDHCFVPHADMTTDACQYADCGKAEMEHVWTVEAGEANPEPDPIKEKMKARIQRLEAALESIAHNTCCDTCREAALVARSALAMP